MVFFNDVRVFRWSNLHIFALEEPVDLITPDETFVFEVECCQCKNRVCSKTVPRTGYCSECRMPSGCHDYYWIVWVVLETGYALNDLWQKCPEYRLFLVLRYCPPDLTPCTWLQIPQLHLLSSSFLVFGSVLCQFVSSERFWDALLAKRYRDVFPPGIKVVGMSKIARTVMPPTNIRDVFFSEVGWTLTWLDFVVFFVSPTKYLSL